MRIYSVISMFLLLALLPWQSFAETDGKVLEQAMSDSLDLWREGRYEQLYEHLSHRGKLSKEQFVKKMRESSIRPACCFQKMENFKVLNEKRSEATVYVKIGLEGTSSAAEATTREFKMSHDAGEWKMQLSDITALAGATTKKHKHKKKRL